MGQGGGKVALRVGNSGWPSTGVQGIASARAAIFLKISHVFLCKTAVWTCIGRGAIIGLKLAVLPVAVGDERVLVRGRDAMR